MPVEGTLARAPGAARRRRARTRSTCALLEDWLRSYRPEELFDDDGPARARARGARAGGRAPHEREPARERRRCCCATSSCPTSATTPSTCRAAGHDLERGDARARHVPARRDRARTRRTSGCSAPTRRRRTASAPSSRSTDRAWEARDRCRPTSTSRPDGRVMEVLSRAPVPGLARGLPADRPPRPVQLLRGVHPHRRLDVQPAREVAEGDARHPVAAADRVAELPAHLARLAPGPQRLLAPGPGLHRPRRQQEGRDHPRLPAARRELPALGRRPLPAQPPLRERDRRRQAAGAQLPLDGRRDRPLHPRHRHLGLGVERRRRRARRRAGLRGRHPDAGDARGRGAPARAPARPARPRRQRRRPHAAAADSRAPARPLRRASSTPCSRPTGRSSSPTTATRG